MWVNRPDRNRTAALKALQLSIHTPRAVAPTTLISNSPPAAREFAAEAPVVYKTLRGVPQRDADSTPGRPLIVYTWPVDPDDVDGSVAHSLCQFQRRIVPSYEVRLIAVGIDLFAARIDSPSGRDGEITDWRAYQRTTRISYTPIDVPGEIRAGVQGFLAALDLLYGALDFMVTADGQWHFLECNPNGQFAFVEYETGLPVADAVADLLSQADTEHATTRRLLAG